MATDTNGHWHMTLDLVGVGFYDPSKPTKPVPLSQRRQMIADETLRRRALAQVKRPRARTRRSAPAVATSRSGAGAPDGTGAGGETGGGEAGGDGGDPPPDPATGVRSKAWARCCAAPTTKVRLTWRRLATSRAEGVHV